MHAYTIIIIKKSTINNALPKKIIIINKNTFKKMIKLFQISRI